MLAEGTCLQGRPNYLEVPVTEDWQQKGTMGPKEKADMIRLMVSLSSLSCGFMCNTFVVSMVQVRAT